VLNLVIKEDEEPSIELKQSKEQDSLINPIEGAKNEEA